MKEYYIKLFYGYEETECGIFHSFEAVDTGANTDNEEMQNRLAESLDADPNSGKFNWDSMDIRLPQSVISKIQRDALVAYGIDPARNYWRENK